jgi:cation diffusion facilitator family transporter
MNVAVPELLVESTNLIWAEMQTRTDLYRNARRAASLGIAVSLGLGLAKLLGGIFGHSLALVSDAVHSLVDAAISAALLGALLVAQRPADNEHPYGHARFEAVAGAGVAVLLILLAIGIGREALGTISHDRVLPSPYTLFIAMGGALIQEALYHYARRVARETGSAALLAAAWDYRLDALGSVAVVLGVALVRSGGTNWAWADHAAAFVVALSVLWVGGTLLWGNIQDLMDRQADPDLLEAVRAEALAVDGVMGVETLRVRKVGLEYLVDMHVEVNPEHTVRDGHAIAHAVKDRVLGQFVPIRDVLVHVEPSENPKN